MESRSTTTLVSGPTVTTRTSVRPDSPGDSVNSGVYTSLLSGRVERVDRTPVLQGSPQALVSLRWTCPHSRLPGVD